jgi:hypothetical protein
VLEHEAAVLVSNRRYPRFATVREPTTVLTSSCGVASNGTKSMYCIRCGQQSFGVRPAGLASSNRDQGGRGGASDSHSVALDAFRVADIGFPDCRRSPSTDR